MFEIHLEGRSLPPGGIRKLDQWIYPTVLSQKRRNSRKTQTGKDENKAGRERRKAGVEFEKEVLEVAETEREIEEGKIERVG